MPTALIGAVGGGGLFSGLLGKLISFAISSIFQSLFAPDEPEQPEPEGPLLNKRSNTSPIPIVYGTRRVGGNRVLVASEGNKNEFLHIVLLVCEGEIDGFEKIYIDDQELRFSGSLTENTSLTPIGAIENNEFGEPEDTDKFKGDDLVRIRLHHGSDTQAADSELTSAVTAWTAQHQLKGRAYIYARFKYDQDTFGGMPTITTDVRGKKISVIDTGTMTIDDTPANAAYSNNPALCLRDYLTNDNYGRGLDPATLDDDKIIEAAEYCDTSITLQFGEPAADGSTSSTGSRYTCDGIVKTDETLYANTQRILTHMRGFLVFTSGLYKLILDKAELSQDFIYDESNIIGSLSVGLGSKKNTLNRMRATFWNPSKNGEDDTIILEPTVVDPEDGQRKTIKEVFDNGVTLSREIQLPYCNNPHSARYLVNQEVEQSRQQIHVTFTVGLAGLRNEIGDIVRVQHAQMGWGYRTVVVDGEVVLIKNGQITIENLGQTGIFPNWNAETDYDSNAIVTFNEVVYKAVGDPSVGTDPDNTSQWEVITDFSQIPLLSSYGLQDLNNDGENDTNIGLDGKFIFKEFRILSLSLKSEEEVEITAIEYDATVFDNLPLSFEDATPNTSFQNPNTIGPPTGLVTAEDLYVTTNSGGVKASLTFTWSSPNTPFVQAYDVEVHVPEQLYSTNISYLEGAKVQFNGNRYQATAFNGPNGTLADPNNSAFWSILSGVDDSDYVYLTRTRTQAATVLDAVPGDYDVRVRAVSVTGVRSLPLEVNNISVQGLIAPPSNITGFGITPQTDLALLQWNPSSDLDVRIGGNIEVRHSPTTTLPANLQTLWASARVLTEGKSGVTTQILVPLLTGSYLIKAVDSSGVESVLPAAIVNTIEPSTAFNFVRTVAEATEWSGITTDNDADDSSVGVEKFGDVLRLDTNSGTQVGSPPTVTSGEYYFGNLVEYSDVTESRLGIDLAFSAANISTLIDSLDDIDSLPTIDGDIPASNVTVEISTTDIDPSGTIAESDWTNYIQFTSGTFNFRAARFRLFISTEALTTQINVFTCSITVEAANVTQTFNNRIWDGNGFTTPGLATNTFDVIYQNASGTTDTPFFNDSSINVFSTPFLGIAADGLLPGEYFVLTNTPNGSDDTGLAPNPFRGFRIQFKRTNTTAGTCTGGTADGTVVTRDVCESGGGTITGIVQLNAPNSTNDGTITRDITFDYQATGF